MDVERFLSAAEVRERLGLAASSFWRIRKAGEFPKPIPIPGRRLVWLEADVVTFIERCKAKRDEDEAA